MTENDNIQIKDVLVKHGNKIFRLVDGLSKELKNEDDIIENSVKDKEIPNDLLPKYYNQASDALNTLENYNIVRKDGTRVALTEKGLTLKTFLDHYLERDETVENVTLVKCEVSHCKHNYVGTCQKSKIQLEEKNQPEGNKGNGNCHCAEYERNPKVHAGDVAAGPA